jgi:hypothetical protein
LRNSTTLALFRGPRAAARHGARPGGYDRRINMNLK